jgi:succinyl-CoA synthetase beta subunit
VKSVDAVRENAEEMLGRVLLTHQTGPEGKQVNRLYIEDGADIAKEYYLSLLVDRDTGMPAFVVSTEGGMDIEDVAEKTPEKIITITVDPATGYQPHHGRSVAAALKLTGDTAKKAAKLGKTLYDAFLATDAAMLEVNPLVETGSGDLLVLDAKMGFDGNALYRQPDIEALQDETEEDEMELEAGKHDLAYVKLDGNIGCMVNGAEPANFLDVGGGATKEKVTAAFKIILSDPAVEGILVNIFGGIMRCDIIADGIVAASKAVNLSVPLVVRLEGTNVEKGKQILADSGLPIVSADNLGDAAQKIVAEVKKAA